MREESVILDPLVAGVTNKISAGSKTIGPMTIQGGLLIEGEHEGDLTVNGQLWVMEGAKIHGGHIRVQGDAYVWGQIGSPSGPPGSTQMNCLVLNLAAQTRPNADFFCSRIGFYGCTNFTGRLVANADGRSE